MRIIDDDLLDRFRRICQCDLCLARVPTGCHPHHILTRGMGGGGRMDVEENLLALCAKCHRYIHERKVNQEAQFCLVAARLGRDDPEEIERELFRLRRAAK